VYLLGIYALGALFPNGSCGQSIFFDDETSGPSIGFSLSKNDIGSGWGGSVGYSFNGRLEVGLSFGNSELNYDDLNIELDAFTFGGAARLYLVKQNEDSPFSLAADGGYFTSSFSNRDFDALGLDMEGSQFSIGGTLMKNSKLSETPQMIPFLSVSLSTVDIEIKNSVGAKISNDDKIWVFQFGLTFAFTQYEDGFSLGDEPIKPKANQIFYLTPSIAISEEVETFGISVGMAFPKLN